MSIETRAFVEFQIDVLDADGQTLRSLPKARNVILNQGLDFIGADVGWDQFLNYLCLGTGALVTKRASGAVTVSAAAGTLTASAGFFVAADVGRVFKMTTGQEFTITAFTSATVVTSSNTATVAASAGTVHYVNLSGLVTETERSNAVDTPLSMSWDAPSSTLTLTVKLMSPTLSAARVYTEVGWSHAGSGANTVFGCAPITPSQSLGIGQKLRVTISLGLKISPSVSTALSGSGLAVGTHGVESIRSDYIPDTINFLNISAVNKNAALLSSSAAIQGLTLATGSLYPPASYINASSIGINSYVAGSYTRALLLSWLDVSGAMTVASLAVYYTQYNCRYRALLTTPVVKTTNDRIDATLTYSWGRTLVN